MSATVLVCGKVFDGASDSLTGPADILVEGNRIRSTGHSRLLSRNRRPNPAAHGVARFPLSRRAP